MGSWAVYAAAAGASLSMATSADAGIISASVDQTVTINPSNVNTFLEPTFVLAGVNEKLALRNTPAHLSHRAAATSSSIGGNGCPNNASCSVYIPRQAYAFMQSGLNFFRDNFDFAVKFARNSPIQGNSMMGTVALRFDEYPASGPEYDASHQHPFNSANDFIGFRTSSGNLGWLQIEVFDHNSDGFVDEAKIIGYGYNTVAGASILAGQTSGGGSSTPEPGSASLAILAAGAAGIQALRRARQAR